MEDMHNYVEDDLIYTLENPINHGNQLKAS